MARYAETTDIDSLLGATPIGALAAGTTPTQAQVQTWLDTESAKADTMIASHYTTPVASGASPNACNILKDLVRNIVAFEVFAAAFPQEPSNPFERLRLDALSYLKQVQSGAAVLPDATDASSSFALGVVETLTANSFNPNTDFEFKVGEVL